MVIIKSIKWVISLFIIGQGLLVSAQTDTRYSQYVFNGMVINPAYAGTTNNLNAMVFYRNQWADIPGAPKTISISIQSPVGSHRKVGLGFLVETDKIGPNDIMDFYTVYSYKVPLGNGVLSAGLQGGATIIQSDLNTLLTPEGVPDIALGNQTFAKPNFGFGLYYFTERYFVSFSAPTLLDYRKADIGPFYDRQYRQYIAGAGVIINLSENLTFKPSLLFKSLPAIAPSRFDLNASIYYKDAIWLGASFRTYKALEPESFGLQMGIKLNNGVKFGYGYDLNVNSIATVSSTGTHQIIFGYEKFLKNTTVMSPRYF